MDNRIPVRDVASGEVSYLDMENHTRELRDSSGRVVKMDLGQSDVHIDSALANVAFGFKLAEGLADIAAPVVPTTKASDKYFVWDKDDALQPAQNLIASAAGNLTELSPRLSTGSFSTVTYALQAFVPTELEQNADSPLRPRMAAMKRLMNALMIGREQRVAAALRNASNYGSAFKATLGASFKWNGGSSSNPVQDLFTQIEAALMPITDIIMSERTYHDFVQNANVQKYIASKINVPGLPSPEQVTGNLALLGLPRIHVAAMKAKSSATAYSYVWGDDVVLLHKPSSLPADGQDTATAYTYRWTGAGAGDGSMQGGFFVRSYYDQKRGARGGTVIVCGHSDAEVFTSDAVSGLIVGCHQ